MDKTTCDSFIRMVDPHSTNGKVQMMVDTFLQGCIETYYVTPTIVQPPQTRPNLPQTYPKPIVPGAEHAKAKSRYG